MIQVPDKYNVGIDSLSCYEATDQLESLYPKLRELAGFLIFPDPHSSIISVTPSLKSNVEYLPSGETSVQYFPQLSITRELPARKVHHNCTSYESQFGVYLYNDPTHGLVGQHAYYLKPGHHNILPIPELERPAVGRVYGLLAVIHDVDVELLGTHH